MRIFKDDKGRLVVKPETKDEAGELQKSEFPRTPLFRATSIWIDLSEFISKDDIKKVFW